MLSAGDGVLAEGRLEDRLEDWIEAAEMPVDKGGTDDPALSGADREADDWAALDVPDATALPFDEVKGVAEV
ncbi:hypothetical protein HBH56_092740 [Parastagonospora nodorum]|nr:hypothetical protein HBH56_092740 [Parastagonospora nodorum]KAH3936317.1 hypothetical protein HBH54_027390 [Parastagonospora nodorum]KAH3948176.1 hypothetical protein HBH53_102210 [Parastagonospora nodorum]KAH3989458.1 hypothetical protein HBH52_015820 [Parastagonospora nodorum]KAH4017280.1 hypothetical protein HBI09_199170 [Parastagonospora nodorum]